tara:strand:- start:1048 stop:1362 length:315 start_codon:yes stop_codon:yes gene_type:complete
MKIFKNFLLINLLFLILSCGVVKEGFENPKKKSSDEFLVEKKSPLVMPPEFNKLPVPENNEQDSNSDQKNIKNLLNENGGQSSVINDSSNESLEKTLLEKIKKN